MNINLLGSWLFAGVFGIMNIALHWNTLSTHSFLTIEFIVRPFYKTIYEKSKKFREKSFDSLLRRIIWKVALLYRTNNVLLSRNLALARIFEFLIIFSFSNSNIN